MRRHEMTPKITYDNHSNGGNLINMLSWRWRAVGTCLSSNYHSRFTLLFFDDVVPRHLLFSLGSVSSQSVQSTSRRRSRRPRPSVQSARPVSAIKVAESCHQSDNLCHLFCHLAGTIQVSIFRIVVVFGTCPQRDQACLWHSMVCPLSR